MSSEYFDTGNDPRIIFAINIISKTIKMIKSRKVGIIKRERIDEVLDDLLKLLNRVRYSYLPKQELIKQDYFKELKEKARSQYSFLMNNFDELKKISENMAKWLRFVLRNIISLQERLLDYSDEPVSAVERCFVNVLSVVRHPKMDKLWIALVSDGSEKFEIITNSPELKTGDILLLAFLPPKEFGGITSEGMFLGPDGIRRGKPEDIGKSPELHPEEKRKILAEIFHYLKQH